jgi:hypothetical protein
MNFEKSNLLNNWIPRRIIKSASPISCEWLFIGEKQFTEPFFEDTIAACRRSIENGRQLKVVSDLEMMASWAAEMNAVPPSAIIFHVSRCGSTLLSQLLSCDPRHIVLSEVPFFDEILRLPFKKEPLCEKTVNKYLDAAVRFYGQRRTGNQQYLFIKADSWHLHFYDQLRFLFPDTPFLLLYRDPSEVIRSQDRQPGIQFVPGLIEPEVFGFTSDQYPELNLQLYRANVLTSYFKKMIQIMQRDSLAFSFNYAEGILNIIKRIYPLLHITLEKGMEERFEERCAFHSKRPQELFSEDRVYREIPKYLEPAHALYEQLQCFAIV